MNQVTVVVSGKRRRFSSMADAIASIQARLLIVRVLDLLDDEVTETIQAVFPILKP